MNANSENPGVGKKFQERVLHIAKDRFGIPFVQENPVPVGKPAKDHRFDIVSEDKRVVIECKCYTCSRKFYKDIGGLSIAKFIAIVSGKAATDANTNQYWRNLLASQWWKLYAFLLLMLPVALVATFYI